MKYKSKIKHHGIKPEDILIEQFRQNDLVYVLRQIEIDKIKKQLKPKYPPTEYIFNINDLEPIE